MEILRGFITVGHDLNNIRFAGDIVFMAETERKQEDLEKLLKESRKKGLKINCKKTERVDVTDRKSPTDEI